MNYYSEKDIRDIVAGVLAQSGVGGGAPACGKEVPVEISARHVHLTTGRRRCSLVPAIS